MISPLVRYLRKPSLTASNVLASSCHGVATLVARPNRSLHSMQPFHSRKPDLHESLVEIKHSHCKKVYIFSRICCVSILRSLENFLLHVIKA